MEDLKIISLLLNLKAAFKLNCETIKQLPPSK